MPDRKLRDQDAEGLTGVRGDATFVGMANVEDGAGDDGVEAALVVEMGVSALGGVAEVG